VSLHCKLVPVQYWEYEYGLSAWLCKAGNQGDSCIEALRVELRILIGH